MREECPHCGATNTDAEFVDVGVGGGGVQVTPYQCYDCDARQFYDPDSAVITAMDVEVYAGWWMGPNEDGEYDHEKAKRSNVWLVLTDQDRNWIATRRSGAKIAQEAKAREALEKLDQERREQEKRDRYLAEALF